MRTSFRTFLGATLLAVVALFAVGFGTAAAQDGVYVSPEVLSNSSAEATPEVLAATDERSTVAATNLAFTGGDVLAITVVGGAAVLAGAGLLVMRRRSDSPADA